MPRESDFDTFYIFGAGGAGRELAWIGRQRWGDAIDIEFLVDLEDAPAFIHDHPVRHVRDITPKDTARYVVAIGDPADRRRLALKCDAVPLRKTALVHPRADIAPTAHVGDGSVICAGCVISTDARIGEHVYVNIGCTVSHDCVLEEFVTLSPGVHVAGHVHVEAGVFIGIGASIINGTSDRPLRIGAGAVIAAGACVTKPVEAGSMVAGVPATTKRT